MTILHSEKLALEQAVVEELLPENGHFKLAIIGDGTIQLTVGGFTDSSEPHRHIDRLMRLFSEKCGLGLVQLFNPEESLDGLPEDVLPEEHWRPLVLDRKQSGFCLLPICMTIGRRHTSSSDCGDEEFVLVVRSDDSSIS
ncbi:hypothetical protein A2480_00995 [Candidatus Uhrbacteria bacterium RIFOXYC2_FULL_47_19]|uniref:Uncharacterized protein n=1 Tax=Candidatus Uhrbacteria bacterium RIFOXYC2_FULL_47_19 TaxID=1802424 RepID=A0A1F7WF37_9BACT|nr:MAG: hypothetical protein A2480_00995 [Candidatus Uhrbacteria bacterium RIFOXYC2_FULL_47_19]